MAQAIILNGMNHIPARRASFLLILSALLLAAFPVKAQEAAPAAAKTQAAPVQLETATPVQEDSEVTIVKDDYAGNSYVTPSMQNLSRLYWKLGVFPLEDKRAIDSFLIINECDIYRTFFSDDFEWANVRETTKEMLEQNKDSFTAQFKILVPIDLGRYDMERGGFDLVSQTAFKNARRVQVTGGGIFTECGQKGDLPGYPSNVVMILNKPFTFDFVKVDEHVAQAFLLRKKYNTGMASLPAELRNRNFQRLAFARMRVTFVRYQGSVTDIGNRPQAILYGRLDGIDVFEDMHEEMLLASVDFK